MTKTRKRAVAYYRKSTKGKDKQVTSIEDQRTHVKEFADRENIRIIDEYIDDGISGDNTENRIAFLQMTSDIDDKNFELVLCWDQDRFGRFDSSDAGYWIYPFKKAGICLMTVTDGLIDWNDYTNRLMYTIRQEGKHQYLRDLSRNVLRGQQEAARNGSWLGSIPTGYVLEGEPKDKQLVLGDAADVALIRRIFDRYANTDRSMMGIANDLNDEGIPSRKGGIWRSDAIKWILKNPVYIGTYRFNVYSRSKYHRLADGQITKGGRSGLNPKEDWIVIPDHHEAIIDKPTFKKVQTRLKKNRRGTSPQYSYEDNPYLLTGKLQCGRCGGPLWAMENRKYRYYECGNRKRDKAACDGSTVREDRVLALLQDFVEEEVSPATARRYLFHQAKRKTLTEETLSNVPSFSRLKQMIVGPERVRNKNTKKQVSSINKNIENAKRNLAVVPTKHVRSIVDSIEKWEKQVAELMESEDSRKPADINATVLDIIRGLDGLLTQEPKSIKKALRQFDNITVKTVRTGNGFGTRHKLMRVEVELVGTTKSKLNPHRSG